VLKVAEDSGIAQVLASMRWRSLGVVNVNPLLLWVQRIDVRAWLRCVRWCTVLAPAMRRD
jgi:hypothetical protein